MKLNAFLTRSNGQTSLEVIVSSRVTAYSETGPVANSPDTMGWGEGESVFRNQRPHPHKARMGHPKGSGTGTCHHALRDPAAAGPSDGAQDRPTLPSGGWGTLCGITPGCHFVR